MPDDEELSGIFLNPPNEHLRALCWTLEKLIAARIDFRCTPLSDGVMWTIAVFSEADSRRLSAWMQEWVRMHGVPTPVGN